MFENALLEPSYAFLNVASRTAAQSAGTSVAEAIPLQATDVAVSPVPATHIVLSPKLHF